VEEVRHAAEHERGRAEEDRQNRGRGADVNVPDRGEDAGLAEALDEVARHGVGVEAVDVEVGLALAGVLVEALAYFEDFRLLLVLVLVLVVVVVAVVAVAVVAVVVVVVVVLVVVVVPVVLDGGHARDAVVADDALARVGQGLAVGVPS